jgi:pre-mRNA-processing factor 39
VDEYKPWGDLVDAAETQEGGSLTRNSSPQAISAARAIYDCFLAKFPLFFVYWKRYADLEFHIAGTEAAEMVRDDSVRFYEQLLTDAGLRAWHRVNRKLG